MVCLRGGASGGQKKKSLLAKHVMGYKMLAIGVTLGCFSVLLIKLDKVSWDGFRKEAYVSRCIVCSVFKRTTTERAVVVPFRAQSNSRHEQSAVERTRALRL